MMLLRVEFLNAAAAAGNNQHSDTNQVTIIRRVPGQQRLMSLVAKTR